MAGNTATISVAAFRADWLTHMPISGLCVRYSITKDQVIRLRDVWELPLRHDRRNRFKPPHRVKDPTQVEIRQRCLEIQARWDERTRQERAVNKAKPVTLKRVELNDEAWTALEQIGDDDASTT